MTSRDHLHDGFAIDDPLGRGIDGPLLSHLMGAAFDRCAPCQADLLAAVADHPPTAARAVELACIAVHEKVGGLPGNLTEPDIHAIASRAFRHLARTGVNHGNEQMFEAAAVMSITDRAAAVDSALDLLVGILSTPA
ncbi:hypothetical protein [Nocardia sp. A7]|uniref:hypothetical protein n=1 Tax=Nocardia sp. A7 TaxID=2789274 RepID=UPI00397C0F38